MNLKAKISFLLILILMVVSGYVRYSQVSDYHTPFTFDQSRDLLDIRALGEFKDLAVMGPTTSINGLRLGPFYYYANLPAYWLGKGNPQALVYWNLAFYLFTGGFIFYFFRKRNELLGLLVSSLFLMAPMLFDTTRYYWNAHMATYISVYYFLALWNFAEKKDKSSIVFLGLTAGCLTQFEAAFGIVTLLWAGLIIIINGRLKNILNFIFSVIPWFLPQIALEIKNNGQMTKLLIGMFSGSNNVLGDKLKLAEVIVKHTESFKYFSEGQLILPAGWGFGVLVVTLIFGAFLTKYRKQLGYLIGFVVFAWIFYVVAYHHPIKGWYIESLRVWYCIVAAVGLEALMVKHKIVKYGLILVLIWLFKLAVLDQWQFTSKKVVDDPKLLKNLLTEIDWVYAKTQGQGFEAYNYVPEIYDYPQQYLYWWYGRSKYGYMPAKVSYSLVEVPEYVRTQSQFYQNTKESDGNKIVLIYENKSQYVGWLNQFKSYCVKERWETEWRTTVELREKCVF